MQEKLQLDVNAEKLCNLLKDKFPNGEVKIVTAESCTAGLIAATIAQVPGSSKWLESGFVVYTAQAKSALLGVNPQTIEKYNITSNEVAAEMAKGACASLEKRDDKSFIVAVSVTGVAGPTNDVPEIPVGTVCIGIHSRMMNDKKFNVYETSQECIHFSGNRNEVREQVVANVLQKIFEIVKDKAVK